MSSMRITFEQFKAACEAEKKARRECLGWSLNFKQEDYQREWHIIAYHAGISEHIQIASANATQDSPAEVLRTLVKSMSMKMGLEGLPEDERFAIHITSTGQIHTGGEYLYKASGSIYLLETGELVDNASANGDTINEAKQNVRDKLVLISQGKKPDCPPRLP